MNRRQRIIVSVTGIFIVLLILIGLTYGYFLTRITGNGNPTSISVTTANLELVYGDGTTSILTSATPIEPGKFSSSKDFTVTNNGNALTEYAVTLEDFSVIYANDTVIDGVSVKAGTVTKMEYPGDMKMSITCTTESEVDERNGKSCGSKEGTLPTENSILLVNSIEKGDTHKYVLTLIYIDSGIDQSVDMNKTIKGKIDIIDTKSTIDLEGSVATYQTGDYVEINSTPIKSEIVDGKYKLIGVETGEHTLNIKYKDSNGNVQTRGSETLTIKKSEEANVSGNTITFTDISRTANVNINNSYDIEISNITDIYDIFISSISHRGYNLVAPENSLAAFSLAYDEGFSNLETDIKFTSDGVPVLLHDVSINRTARNSDGSELTDIINIKDITYEEVLNYDFGIYQSNKYAGTRILSLNDFIEFCKEKQLRIHLDLAYNITQKEINTIINIIKEYDYVGFVTLQGYNYKTLNYIKSILPTIKIAYCEQNSLTEDTVREIAKINDRNNEVIISQNFSYLTNETVELCKKYSLPLIVWTVDSEYRISNLDSYISGVISNIHIAGKVLYENLNKSYLEEYQIVKKITSSDISYRTSLERVYPYYKSTDTRASYIAFDILLDEGYIYKFEFISEIESTQMALQALTSRGFIKVNHGLTINTNSNGGDFFDSGWQKSGYEFNTDNKNYKVVRLIFMNNDKIFEDYIKNITISKKSA